MKAPNCPKCGGHTRSAALGWICESCHSLIDMNGKFHEYIERPFLPPMTIADQIRSMTDEQMAEKIYDLYCKLADGTINDISLLYCDGKAGCIDKDGNITCTDEMHKACILRWFQSPAKEV